MCTCEIGGQVCRSCKLASDSRVDTLHELFKAREKAKRYGDALRKTENITVYDSVTFPIGVQCPTCLAIAHHPENITHAPDCAKAEAEGEG